MQKDLENKLHALAERGERLLSALEQRYPPRVEPDWSAPAFRWQPPQLVAVKHVQQVQLNELQAISAQKQTLIQNTEQFLRGAPANNALLWGARGTGKSSLIKALLTRFYEDGLRLIEVEAHDLVDLPDIVAALFDRPERFIIYADDLSFEAGDASYKTLKAILDGSVAAAPDNVLIYATSNRRHLLPEYQQENREAQNINGEIHHGDAVEEKISLSERFGLWLSFYPFQQAAYLEIVASQLRALGADPDQHPETKPALDRAALQWALARGSRSGRVAQQFARDWAGRRQLP